MERCTCVFRCSLSQSFLKEVPIHAGYIKREVPSSNHMSPDDTKAFKLSNKKSRFQNIQVVYKKDRSHMSPQTLWGLYSLLRLLKIPITILMSSYKSISCQTKSRKRCVCVCFKPLNIWNLPLPKRRCGMIANETTIHKRPKWHRN